jgi:anti-sigma factor RsiW
MTERTDMQHAQTSEIKLTCQQLTDIILDYVTNEMEPALRAAFERHLERCVDCVAFLHTYQETIRATRSVCHEDMPVEMVHRVQNFLLERIKGSPASATAEGAQRPSPPSH